MARQFLGQFSTRVRQGEESIHRENGAVHFSTNHTASFEEADGTIISSVSYSVVDATITKIAVAPYGTEIAYNLFQLLTTYGVPSEALVFSGGRSYGFAFELILYYPLNSFLAYYNYPAIWSSDLEVYEACPDGRGPSLWLWPADLEQTIEDLAPLGESQPYFQPITVATGLDEMALYDRFTQHGTQACLETPTSIWP